MTGEQGVKGDKGERGPHGDHGQQGDKGDEGLGWQGDEGARGDTGARGIKGDKGDPGHDAPDLTLHADRLADGLADVAKSLRETDRHRRVTQLLIATLALFFAIYSVSYAFDRHEATRQRARIVRLTTNTNMVVHQLKGLLSTMQDATTPSGCIAARNEAFRAEAVRRIENDNRTLHRANPIEPDPAIMMLIGTPCPGE